MTRAPRARPGRRECGGEPLFDSGGDAAYLLARLAMEKVRENPLATKASKSPAGRPDGATGALALADGTIFLGRGAGAVGQAVGEVCFNTAMTGYQEILTDPSYAAQLRPEANLERCLETALAP